MIELDAALDSGSFGVFSDEIVNVEENLLLHEREIGQTTQHVVAEYGGSLISLHTLDPSSSKPNVRLGAIQGDITSLKIGAIVTNASSPYLLGCSVPNHRCLDRSVHLLAGPSLRKYCQDMRDYDEEWNKPLLVGGARVTGAYCLPCGNIIHTLGPLGDESFASNAIQELGLCYKNCLDIAVQNGIRSVAFSNISVGALSFSIEKAAPIAVSAVLEWLSREENAYQIDLIVFVNSSHLDCSVYTSILRSNISLTGDNGFNTGFNTGNGNGDTRPRKRISLAVRKGLHYPHVLQRAHELTSEPFSKASPFSSPCRRSYSSPSRVHFDTPPLTREKIDILHSSDPDEWLKLSLGASPRVQAAFHSALRSNGKRKEEENEELFSNGLKSMAPTDEGFKNTKDERVFLPFSSDAASSSFLSSSLPPDHSVYLKKLSGLK